MKIKTGNELVVSILNGGMYGDGAFERQRQTRVLEV